MSPYPWSSVMITTTFGCVVCATACIGPGSANVIGGQFVAVKTYGNRIDDMIIKDPLSLKIAFGLDKCLIKLSVDHF